MKLEEEQQEYITWNYSRVYFYAWIVFNLIGLVSWGETVQVINGIIVWVLSVLALVWSTKALNRYKDNAFPITALILISIFIGLYIMAAFFSIP